MPPPILGATPFSRAQAGRPQLDLSIATSLFPLPLLFRGCGPQSWSKKRPIAKLSRSGLEIGAFNSSCKSVKWVSFCPTCPGMPDQPRLAWFNRFAQSTAESPYTLQWATLSPKIAPSHGGSEPPSNTWSLGPTQVLNPNSISIGSAVFAWITSVTDRPTDHAIRSLTIDRIYVRRTAMRSNNKTRICHGQPIYQIWR